MNPTAWYSRLAIWIAALLLFVEAVSGHSIGVLTVLAICTLAAGLLAFTGSLAWLSAVARTSPATKFEHDSVGSDVDPAVAEPQPFPQNPTIERDKVPAEFPAHTPISVTQAPTTESAGPPPEAEAPVPDTRAAPPLPTLARLDTLQSPRTARVAVTVRDASGAACLRCQEPVRQPQLAAICPVCGAEHHVICWIENRFHCSREGCSGHGSLEEPGS